MIIKLIIIFVVGIISYLATLYLLKKFEKEWNPEIERYLISRIKTVETIKDCDDLLNEIREKIKTVDPLFKTAFDKYKNYYHFVLGIKESLLK